MLQSRIFADRKKTQNHWNVGKNPDPFLTHQNPISDTPFHLCGKGVYPKETRSDLLHKPVSHPTTAFPVMCNVNPLTFDPGLCPHPVCTQCLGTQEMERSQWDHSYLPFPLLSSSPLFPLVFPAPSGPNQKATPRWDVYSPRREVSPTFLHWGDTGRDKSCWCGQQLCVHETISLKSS